MAAAGVDAEGLRRSGDLIGRLLDTFVHAQLWPELALLGSSSRLSHLRTEQGRHEVDLIAEHEGRVVGIEVKAGGVVTARDARHLAWLRDQLGDEFARGVVLHTGPGAYEVGERILAAPIAALWTTRQ
jgi:predicted AAA+ superfamily ATPase